MRDPLVTARTWPDPWWLCQETWGGGLTFSVLREGLQAALVQNLLGDAGVPLGPAHLLWLATAAGATALGLDDAGHLSEGMAFDAVWLRPEADSTLDIGLRHAADEADAVAKAFALGGTADVHTVWVGGDEVWSRP